MLPDYKKIIDQETWAFIDKTESFYPPDTAQKGVAEQRRIYDALCAAFRAPRPSNVAVSDRVLGGVSVRDYSTGGGQAHVLYFHGGGFVVGGLDSHDDVCAELCAQTGFDVTAVDYRLSPESFFPADFEDAMTAWSALSDQFPGQVILVGDSAGGTICAGLSHALRSEPRRPNGQVLIYPALGMRPDSFSMKTHAHAPMLTREDCAFFRNARVGAAEALLEDPRCSPLKAESFDGLPITVVVSAECDPLASDGEAYVSAIAAAGGEAHYVCERGLVHGYLRARHSVDRARRSFVRIVGAISDLGNGISLEVQGDASRT